MPITTNDMKETVECILCWGQKIDGNVCPLCRGIGRVNYDDFMNGSLKIKGEL